MSEHPVADLHLDEPLSAEQLAHIVKWYEDEVADPQFAATHDCHVVRAFRELLRLKSFPPSPKVACWCPFCGEAHAIRQATGECSTHGENINPMCRECFTQPAPPPRNCRIWQCIEHNRLFAAHAGCSLCRAQPEVP